MIFRLATCLTLLAGAGATALHADAPLFPFGGDLVHDQAHHLRVVAGDAGEEAKLDRFAGDEQEAFEDGFQGLEGD